MSGGGFRFRLQRLLELRRLRERESAREVAQARIETEAARQAIEQLGSVRAAGAAELTRTLGPRTAGELQRMSFLLNQLDEHIAVADDVLQQAEHRMAETVAQYQDAARMRQALDRLREKQQDQWRLSVQHSEQKELDEIATLRHNSAAETES